MSIMIKLKTAIETTSKKNDINAAWKLIIPAKIKKKKDLLKII